MTVFRVKHQKNYTVINNFICTDNRLSWKAKGIWLYAFYRPDDWIFHMSDLMNQSTDGRESVRSGLKELEEYGYLHREQCKDINGKYDHAEWSFYETPQELKKLVPQTGNTFTEKSTTENHPLLSTEEKLSTEAVSTSLLHKDVIQQQQEGAKPPAPPAAEEREDVEKLGINYISPGGRKMFISESDIFSSFLKSGYQTSTIKKAIIRIQNKDEPIGNVIKLIDIICKEIENIDKLDDKKIKKTHYSPTSVGKSNAPIGKNPFKEIRI